MGTRWSKLGIFLSEQDISRHAIELTSEEICKITGRSEIQGPLHASLFSLKGSGTYYGMGLSTIHKAGWDVTVINLSYNPDAAHNTVSSVILERIVYGGKDKC